MYLGLALMTARPDSDQANIQPFTNAIFSGASMSFIAVAYIPAYLENHTLFFKVRKH
jgi:hypothetical protein